MRRQGGAGYPCNKTPQQRQIASGKENIAPLILCQDFHSHCLKWGKQFTQMPTMHSYQKSENMTRLSTQNWAQLNGYIELIGEGRLYRDIMHEFRAYTL